MYTNFVTRTVIVSIVFELLNEQPLYIKKLYE